jgi:hypothetical protein
MEAGNNDLADAIDGALQAASLAKKRETPPVHAVGRNRNSPGGPAGLGGGFSQLGIRIDPHGAFIAGL